MVAVFAVPVIVLVGIVGTVAVGRRSESSQAGEVRDRVQELSALLVLGTLLDFETTPLRAALDPRIGTDLTQILGLDRPARTDTFRADVNRAAAPFAGDEWLRDGLSGLATVRAHADAGRLGPSDLETMTDLTGRVHTRIERLGGTLTTEVGVLDSGSLLGRRVGALVIGYKAYLSYTARLGALFDLGRGTARTPAQLAREQDRLVAQGARYGAEHEEVLAIADPAVARGWREAESTPESRALEAAVTLAQQRYTGEVPVAQRSVDERRALLRNGLEATAQRARLVDASAALLLTGARQTEERSQRAYLGILVLAALALGLVAAAVTVTVLGVVRPLRRLADRARMIADGEMDPAESPSRGPREVRDVGRAVDDIATTLRMVERQAGALAVGDAGEGVLGDRAPGRLGRSLQLSMDRLTESITAREELESRLRHESTHDRLTGLLNRGAALVALGAAVLRGQRHGTALAVLLIDLDGLTRINESGGHGAGDQVLRTCSNRLRRVARAGDIVARLGADEFVVVAEVAGIEAAIELARRVQRELRTTPLPPQAVPAGTSRHLDASIGVVLAQDGHAEPAALLHDADLAVRRAKVSGGGSIELFDEQLRNALDERSRIEVALAAAMGNGDLQLHYQPIVDPHGEVLGVEALCRWTDPELGRMSPELFIGVAELSDLVVDLDRWVLRRAAAQLLEWSRDPALDGIYLAVNISGRHFLKDVLVQDVHTVLRETGVDPCRLVVEITETVLMTDFIAAADQLGRLRALGVRVAVDDFGTGYTSISHLQRLPIDIVKIDRSFVADISGERGHSLVRLMVDMARTLGLGLVAEGVERPEEFERLRELGCSSLQGYLFGRPSAPSGISWGTRTSSR